MPRNTASNPDSSSSKETSEPMLQPRRNSTPMPAMISWRFSSTSFSSLKGGMPKVSSPPMRALRVTERIAAGQAAAGLLCGALRVIGCVDLAEVAHPRLDGGLGRIGTRDIEKLQILIGHALEAASGRAPQVIDQQIDGGSLGLHHPELGQEGAQVVHDLRGPFAVGLGDVPLEQRLEVLNVRLHRLGVDAADVDQLVGVAVDEVALKIEDVGEPSGKPSAEVNPGAPEHAHRAAGHVLAAVIARALDHGDRAGIAYREALTGDPRGIQLPAGGAVQAGVAHDDGVARHELRARGMAPHEAAARHALAHVVIRVPLEVEV